MQKSTILGLGDLSIFYEPSETILAKFYYEFGLAQIDDYPAMPIGSRCQIKNFGWTRRNKRSFLRQMPVWTIWIISLLMLKKEGWQIYQTDDLAEVKVACCLCLGAQIVK